MSLARIVDRNTAGYVGSSIPTPTHKVNIGTIQAARNTVLESVRQVQFPTPSQDPGELQEWQQALDGFDALVRERLTPRWNFDGLASADLDTERGAEVFHLTRELTEVLGVLMPFRDRAGRRPAIGQSGAEIEAFRSHGEDQRIAFDLAQFGGRIMTDVADGGQPRSDAYDDEIRAFWDGRHEWLQDMLLSIGEERLKLAQQQGYRGEVDEPARLPELYYLLLRMEPALNTLARERGATEASVIDWGALTQLRDFYGYNAGDGYSLRLLSKMLFPDMSISSNGRTGPDPPIPASLTPPSSPGGPSDDDEPPDDPPPPRPIQYEEDDGVRVDFNHELNWIRDALLHQDDIVIRLLQRNEQVFHRVNIRRSVLRDVYHILLRLAQPDQHPSNENVVAFARLNAIVEEARNGSPGSDYRDFHNWSEADGDLMDYLRGFYLPAARYSDEINPITPQVDPGVAERLAQRLSFAEDATAPAVGQAETRDHRATVAAVQMAFEHGRADWSQRQGIEPDHANHFLGFLTVMTRMLELANTPEALYRSEFIRTRDLRFEFARILYDLDGILNAQPIRGVRITDYVPVVTELARDYIARRRQPWGPNEEVITIVT
ncbi:hypothetical protein LTR85_009539 [Meristemomyces frigidus]|nr:hypothetical protein LTR85_009539 [Meristemomyces frigidus]